MTRDDVIKAMTKAIWKALHDSEDPTLISLYSGKEAATAALSALEAMGLALVPVEQPATAKQNWGYVTFSEYEADTTELAERGGAIASQLVREREQHQRTFAAIVIAAGGSIRVPQSALIKVGVSEVTLETSHHPSDDSVEFRVSIASPLRQGDRPVSPPDGRSLETNKEGRLKP